MPATLGYAGTNFGVNGPYTAGETVTPHDTNEFANAATAIWVGTTGNAAVVLLDGTVLQFNSIPAGTLLRIACKRVNSTNTTASNMVALR